MIIALFVGRAGSPTNPFISWNMSGKPARPTTVFKLFKVKTQPEKLNSVKLYSSYSENFLTENDKSTHHHA